MRSVQATPGEVAELMTAKQALAAAETQRQLALDALFQVDWLGLRKLRDHGRDSMDGIR